MSVNSNEPMQLQLILTWIHKIVNEIDIESIVLVRRLCTVNS